MRRQQDNRCDDELKSGIDKEKQILTLVPSSFTFSYLQYKEDCFFACPRTA